MKNKLRNILPLRILNLYFGLYPFIGNFVFGRPSHKLKIVAITGTDGKSSSVIFTARILKEAGYKVGFFSSVAYSYGNEERLNIFKMTMPGRFFLQRFLKKLVDNKCDFGVIEATSEGIKQKRHLFIDFDIALVTNIKPEHIESHGGFKRYKHDKSVIFRNLSKSYLKKDILKTIIVNNDNEDAKDFLAFSADQKLTFGINEKSDVWGKILSSDLFQNIFEINCGNEKAVIQISSGGPFIIENALAASAVAKALKIDFDVSVAALKKITNPPGRFEIVSKKPFIIVDYAHTVAALEKILSFVRKNWKGEIIHLFGAAGGGRDKWKRPHLAELSEKFTDFSVLSEENSFDESMADIISDIMKGFKNKERVFTIPNRTEAVKAAMELQSNFKNALLILTGKGSETVIMGPYGQKNPYNEKQIVLCQLNNY